LPQAAFYPTAMPKTPRNLRKLSPFFLFPLTLFLTLLLSLPWVSAQEPPKPQPWQIDGIVAALDDGHDKVKEYALRQLDKYEPQDLKAVLKKPEDIAKKAADILKDEQMNLSVRSSAAEALGKIRKLELNEVVVILNTVYEPNQSSFEAWRFFTYFLSGGTDEVKTLLQWLGYPQETPPQLNYKDGKKTLEVFLKTWEHCQELELLRKDLAEQIAIVAANKKLEWRWQDIGLLKHHYNNLKTVYPTKATVVQSAINKLEFWQWLLKARNTIFLHITFWLALIFAYPKFPQVQAIFFWNPWVRKILGVGYVGFLLTWIPYLRRKLFEPFKPSLQADAGLDTFGNLAYFPQSQVKVPGSGETKPITEALPSIQGQIVLEGDSGWGKSMFLRHLVANSRQIIVYLPAQKCNQGVIEAIQAKLHGQAQDAQFLKNLIYPSSVRLRKMGVKP